jgi:hypothetical protein
MSLNMSNESDNNIFRFAYGELNDVTPPEGPLDRQQSGRDNAFTRLGRGVHENHRPDPYGKRQKWYGVVLRIESTPEEGLTEENFTGWEKVHNRFADNPDLVRVKVRIPELHATIPEPRTYSADPEALSMEDQLSIDRHPTFIAEKVGMQTPNIGDIVMVKYNRQSGQAIYLGLAAGLGVAAAVGTYRVGGFGAFAVGGASFVGATPGGGTNVPEDDGTHPTWSNGRAQRTVTWQSEEFPEYNGTIIKNGELEATGMLMEDQVSGAKLIPPAMADWLQLAAAYKLKFDKDLKGSGYRTYRGQVITRLQRHDSDDVYLGGCSDTDPNTEGTQRGPTFRSGQRCSAAATPGTSNHGWGAAVDCDRSDWGGGAGDNSSEFRWLNRFAHNFNFVFGVNGEHWHLDWMKWQDCQATFRVTQSAWVNAGQDDEAVTAGPYPGLVPIAGPGSPEQEDTTT